MSAPPPSTIIKARVALHTVALLPAWDLNQTCLIKNNSWQIEPTVFAHFRKTTREYAWYNTKWVCLSEYCISPGFLCSTSTLRLRPLRPPPRPSLLFRRQFTASSKMSSCAWRAGIRCTPSQPCPWCVAGNSLPHDIAHKAAHRSHIDAVATAAAAAAEQLWPCWRTSHVCTFNLTLTDTPAEERSLCESSGSECYEQRGPRHYLQLVLQKRRNYYLKHVLTFTVFFYLFWAIWLLKSYWRNHKNEVSKVPY